MNVPGSTPGIVLAAGHSTRMGRPKALLSHAGEPFVARCVRALAEGGCDPVLVVVAEGAEAIHAAAEAAGARVIHNPDPAAEQVDSLRLAASGVAATARAIVFTPVDAPRIHPATVAALIEAFERDAAPVVVPVHRGERGHPTLFSAETFPELLGGVLPHGARSLVEAHEGRLAEVQVDDPAILEDIDTPDRVPPEE